MIGALWLARKHWLVVKPALRAGLVVGGLLAAVTLSAAPAAWFGFDTAQSTTTFWLRQAGAAFAVAVGGGLGYALVFMTAESLTRRAFPAHPQLWHVWSKDAAPTRSILGRTLGGYLFVPIELALVAAFYYATNRWLGWWQPSEVLTDPNILSYAMPALMPIAVSLQAGFMEECLFRAVPLALGALIGARFGHRSVGIGVAFVLQAVVFGAAHANYPGFPSVFAARRAHRAGDDVGGDLPALRLAADDPAARAVRSLAVLDTALSRRRAARVGAARAGGRRGAGAARDRSVAARARRRVAGVAGFAAQRRVGDGARRRAQGHPDPSPGRFARRRLGPAIAARAGARRARRVGCVHADAQRRAGARHRSATRGVRGRCRACTRAA